jgi:hypothetical protein
MHEANLIVSEVVFRNPCLIESQEESLITTGGGTEGVVLSDFEQEYVIITIVKTKSRLFFIL